MTRLWEGFKTGLVAGIPVTVVMITFIALVAMRCMPGQAKLEIGDRKLLPLACTVSDRTITLSSPAQPGYAVHLYELSRGRGWRAGLVQPSGVTSLYVESCDTLDIDVTLPGTQYTTGKLVIACPGVIGRVDLGACR